MPFLQLVLHVSVGILVFQEQLVKMPYLQLILVQLHHQHYHQQFHHLENLLLNLLLNPSLQISQLLLRELVVLVGNQLLNEQNQLLNQREQRIVQVESQQLRSIHVNGEEDNDND